MKEEARQAVSWRRSQHPTDEFYGFALVASVWHVEHHAASEASYQADLRRLSSRGPDDLLHLRWNPHGWHSCDPPDRLFEAGSLVDEAFEQTDDEFEVTVAMCASMVRALWELNAEGLFGTGEARERVTLLCTAVGDGCAWLEKASARLLNPKTVNDAFMTHWVVMRDNHAEQLRKWEAHAKAFAATWSTFA